MDALNPFKRLLHHACGVADDYRQRTFGEKVIARTPVIANQLQSYAIVARCVLFLLVCMVAPSARAIPSVTTNNSGSLILTNDFGDLNDDHQLNVLDVVLLTHHLNVTIPLAPALTNRADLNLDSVITTADRTILADMIACRNTKADDDFDSDELSNAQEMQLGTNPLNPDTDGDGWLDGWEVVEGTNPLDAQSIPKPLVIARPPVQVISPLIQDADTNMLGVVMARPPVQVIYPLIQDTDTNMFGVVLARPPVQVISPALPEVEEAGATTLGCPPVLIFSPALAQEEEAGAATLGHPPVLIFFPALPQAEEAGATTLGRPPVTVTNPPPQ